MTLLQDWVDRLFSLYNVFWNTGSSVCLLHDRSNHLSQSCKTISVDLPYQMLLKSLQSIQKVTHRWSFVTVLKNKYIVWCPAATNKSSVESVNFPHWFICKRQPFIYSHLEYFFYNRQDCNSSIIFHEVILPRFKDSRPKAFWQYIRETPLFYYII